MIPSDARRYFDIAGLQRPHRHSVIDIVRATAHPSPGTTDRYPYTNIHGRLAEVYALEQLRMAAQQVENAIELFPIPDDAETANYRFHQSSHWAPMMIYSEDMPVTDLDGLLTIDGSPWLIESKFAELGKAGRHRRLIQRVIANPKAMNAMKPLQEYFGQPINVALYVAPDQFDPAWARQFEGCVFRGPHTLGYHRTLCHSLADEYGFLIA